MEEIAFGVLSTAYEQWSYDDTDSDVPGPPVRSISPYPSKYEEERFSCTDFSPCQLNFINREDLWAHIGNHLADQWPPPGPNSTLNPLQDISVTESIPQADSNYSLRYDDWYMSASMVPDYQETAEDNYYGAAGEDNYWTRSAHPSSSASSINSQLRTSLSNDYQQSSPLMPKELLGASMPPAPQSTMNQSSLKVSAAPDEHKCRVCDKRFFRVNKLRAHMNVNHPGEKPFACEVEGCGRRFFVVSNLRRHRKVHKNEYQAHTDDDDDDDN
ncbi:hypothetical protein FB567DRAFT_596647 [Paraphoma chrysanthemicola]|uniref:C2H2 type master regulator of conidiophore development brlA n=1 Tax=Paraphoma chrysanthemicola TaxID=798071 RepID=A0A8K0VTV8_9PLEO|nr:hypothetical protein FB567DRAFT_596647 [Paraphoma chrysanthemicola]